MRTLADIFGPLIGARSAIHEIEAARSIIGIVIWALGILATIGGCLISAAVQGGGLVVWLGLGMTVAGWLISYSASNKTYPECAERVKYEALKCPDCGHEFVAASQVVDVGSVLQAKTIDGTRARWLRDWHRAG